MSCQTIDESHKRVCFNSYDSFLLRKKSEFFFPVFQNEWLCQHVLRLGRRRRWPTSSNATAKLFHLSELANHLKILHAVSWACKSCFVVLLFCCFVAASSNATTKFLHLSELAYYLKILYAVSWACKYRYWQLYLFCCFVAAFFDLHHQIFLLLISVN